MLDDAWNTKEKNDANVMAVLKRTHIIVNTNTSLYIRPAGEKCAPVLRMCLGDKTDYLHVDSRKIYDFHRKGGTDLPADFQQNVAWEQAWLEKAMKGDRNLPYRATIIQGRSPFMDGEPTGSLGVSDTCKDRNLQEHLLQNLHQEPSQMHQPQPRAAASSAANLEVPSAPSHATRRPAVVKEEPPSSPPRVRVAKRENPSGPTGHKHKQKVRELLEELGGQPMDLTTPPSTPPRAVKQEPLPFNRALSVIITEPIDVGTPSPSRSHSVLSPHHAPDDLEKDLERIMQEEMVETDEMDVESDK